MAKKQKCPEHENHERWLVSFADMMTLLFALFVVLFSLKEDGRKDSKVEQAVAAIQESFNEVIEDIPVDRRLGPTEAGFGIFDRMKGNQIRPPLSPMYPTPKEQIRVIDAEMKKVSIELENRLYGDQKFRQGEKNGFRRVVSVHREQDGFKIRLLASHFFKSGDYRLSNNAKKELDEIAKIVKKLGRNITVEGHTDSIPPKGHLNNWQLSALRATYVIRYFIEKSLFPPTRLSAAGYGDTRPISSNNLEKTRRLNRRIEIKVNYK